MIKQGAGVEIENKYVYIDYSFMDFKNTANFPRREKIRRKVLFSSCELQTTNSKHYRLFGPDTKSADSLKIGSIFLVS